MKNGAVTSLLVGFLVCSLVYAFPSYAAAPLQGNSAPSRDGQALSGEWSVNSHLHSQR